jgi:anti-sigma B factor antagonist
MAFKVESESRDGIRVLHVRGRLTLGEESATLRDAITAVTEPSARIVLDLGDVQYVDSAGLGTLVAAYTSVTSQGGRLALAALRKRVSDLLQITKLYTVFSVFDTVDQAVAAMSAPRT